MKKALLIIIFLFVSMELSAYKNTYALIIAISDYKDQQDLKYTVNDARLFVNFLLSEKGGCVSEENIVTLIDYKASKINVINKAKVLFAKVEENDRVIIYFSGHGNREAFMLYDTPIYYSELQQLFKMAKCKSKIMFADACYSGALKNKNNSRNSDDGKRDKDQQIAVMLSCSDNEVSIERGYPYEQGLFSYYLIKGLSGEADRNNNGKITIKELYTYVYRNTTDDAARGNSKQTPVLFGNFDLNLIVGYNTEKYNNN